tara:strand:- start:1095 stop:1223 length:129 start_codon:yes stop_codon:yes gene_type:complete
MLEVESDDPHATRVAPIMPVEAIDTAFFRKDIRKRRIESIIF